jgi:hypothetical protein
MPGPGPPVVVNVTEESVDDLDATPVKSVPGNDVFNRLSRFLDDTDIDRHLFIWKFL